ncbi:alpha-galactosidase [Arachidicoccus ginsenosidivorans]
MLFVVILLHGQPVKPGNNLPAFIKALKSSRPYAESPSANELKTEGLTIHRKWQGNVCHSYIENKGDLPVTIGNIVLFEMNGHLLDPDSKVYGEGFQMLTQITGTLAHPLHESYTDEGHYHIIGPHKMPTAYGLFTLTQADNQSLLLGFSTCERFIGCISFTPKKIMVSIDAENLVLQPGQRVQLEDFMLLSGLDKNKLYDQLTKQIAIKHPPIFGKQVPTGWCSWYCYGPEVTQKDIEENMDGLAASLPEVKYIQIDDGYQPHMGDWLQPNPAYGSLEGTLEAIRKKGFVPAIWLAPFIAEKDSKLFQQHPDWFVQDSTGKPLVSSSVGFGGWRNAPWYVLDGTNPHAKAYIKHVVKTMREKWGVEYFKLDANYWGAIHGGVHYDKSATRIQAYREGMKALLSACGKNTVVLGCNQPMWPSLGLITAARTSNDVSRNWAAFKSTAKENLQRGWQNGKLWYTDPDCFLIGANGAEGKSLTANEFLFHATVVHAIGGLVLLGDKYNSLCKQQFAIIKKQIHPTGKAARFSDDFFQTGITDLGKVQYYYFLNWHDDTPTTLKVKLKAKATLENYWQGTPLGIHQGEYTLKDLPPRSGLIIKATDVE